MSGVAPVSARQFALFRVAFGAYLTIHFAHLVPWSAELFSGAGVLPDSRLNPIHGVFPNILNWWDSPAFVTAFLIALTVLSVLFMLGVARQASAILIWYGWACLFNRNVLIVNPSIPYVGLMLVLTTLVPARESFLPGRTSQASRFYVPAGVYWTFWVLLASGYTFSGIAKAVSPSWIDGSALWHVLQNPLARPGLLRDLALMLPPQALHAATWAVLALEVAFLPLAVFQWTRLIAWSAAVVLHVGIIGLVSFADLSLGMLVAHAFTFDARWPGMCRSVRAIMPHAPTLARRSLRLRPARVASRIDATP